MDKCITVFGTGYADRNQSGFADTHGRWIRILKGETCVDGEPRHVNDMSCIS